jgi:hypothetical protein
MTTITPRRAAIIAGIGYAAIFILAIFANFFVKEGLVVADDAAATFANIAESETLFRAGILAFLIIFLIEVVVAWALHMLFRTVNRQVSLLAAWFRIAFTVLLGVAVVFLFAAVQLVGEASSLSAFSQGQLEMQATLMIDAFNTAWMIGLAAFGLHLILIGSMTLNARMASRVLGILLAVAGGAYVVDTFAQMLMTNYADYADVFLALVAVPSMVGEFAFMAWLLRKAGRGNDDGGTMSLVDVTSPDAEVVSVG